VRSIISVIGGIKRYTDQDSRFTQITMESTRDYFKRRIKEVGLTKLEPWELQHLLVYLKEQNLLRRIVEVVTKKDNP